MTTIQEENFKEVQRIEQNIDAMIAAAPDPLNEMVFKVTKAALIPFLMELVAIPEETFTKPEMGIATGTALSIMLEVFIAMSRFEEPKREAVSIISGVLQKIAVDPFYGQGPTLQ